MARKIDINQFVADLKSDLKLAEQNLTKDVAIQIRDDLTETTRLSIELFYASYPPKYYNRHFYNLRRYSYKKYYVNSHYKKYYGGVEMTPNDMDWIYKSANPEYIYTSVIEKGMHGWVNSKTPHPPQMNISPLEMILKRKKYIINHIDKYINKAVSKQKKSHYKRLFRN